MGDMADCKESGFLWYIYTDELIRAIYFINQFFDMALQLIIFIIGHRSI